jgi:nitrate/TMAO reductase-like tetraheme cytochrome c subunit
MFGRLIRMRILGAGLGAALVFFVAGIVFWGGFNTAMEASNTPAFCSSCHEMRTTVLAEYTETGHFQNRTGVRATCSDCHVPDPWVYKFGRKIMATNELVHWALGSIGTSEKFEAKRLTLAKTVWKAMKATDSRECRNCHSWDGMRNADQKPRAAKEHANAQADKMTCIDCHKGVAHRAIHRLLPDDYPFYDGKPDTAFRLPLISPEQLKAEMAARRGPPPAAPPAAAPAVPPAAAVAPGAPAPTPAAAVAPGAPAPAGARGVDWSKAGRFETVLLYPGQASIEWLLKGTDHGGARAVRKGDRCFECHGKEAGEMGQKMVTGAKAEATPIPGKRGSIPLAIEAAHDGENLHLRFRWPDAPHTPAPFVDGGKLDPENQVKLAFMVSGDGVEMGASAGCWAACHHDSRFMPDAPPPDALAASPLKDRLGLSAGVTKYLRETRTAVEVNNPPRGGWDKLRPPADIQALRQQGTFMDLARFRSAGKHESGHVLEQRVMVGGQPVVFAGERKDGAWAVTMRRPLKAEKPGYAFFEPGKLYTISVAIHDDFTTARFHHVSLELTLGLDNREAQINAVKQ